MSRPSPVLSGSVVWSGEGLSGSVVWSGEVLSGTALVEPSGVDVVLSTAVESGSESDPEQATVKPSEATTTSESIRPCL